MPPAGVQVNAVRHRGNQNFHFFPLHHREGIVAILFPKLKFRVGAGYPRTSFGRDQENFVESCG